MGNSRLLRPLPAGARLAVITDVDGCLLDARTYRLGPARVAARRLARSGIPIILCTSKTRAEVRVLREELGLRLPAIIESGGAVVVPVGTLPVPAGRGSRTRDGLLVPLAAGIDEVRAGLAAIERLMPGGVRGFTDMTRREVLAWTGLKPAAVTRSRRREFDEPFVFLRDPRPHRKAIRLLLADRGLAITRGAIMNHLHGRTDKGHAARIVMRWLTRAHGPFVTVGLGDGPHDLALLRAVDRPVIVPHPDGKPDPYLRRGLPRAPVAPAPGPRGWAAVAEEILAAEPGRVTARRRP